MDTPQECICYILLIVTDYFNSGSLTWLLKPWHISFDHLLYLAKHGWLSWMFPVRKLLVTTRGLQHQRSQHIKLVINLVSHQYPINSPFILVYGISHIVFPLDISPYFVGGHITGIITINYIINIPLYTIISSWP